MKKAFTLIELIIFMGIFSVLIFIFTDIFVSALKTKTLEEATASVNQDANFVLMKLQYDINNASSVTQPELNNTSESLYITIDGVGVLYRMNAGRLERVVGTEAVSLNGYNTTLTSLYFKNMGTPEGKSTVKIALTLESKGVVNNRSEVINLETTAGLR